MTIYMQSKIKDVLALSYIPNELTCLEAQSKYEYMLPII